MLLDIARNVGDELAGGPASFFPRVHLADPEGIQEDNAAMRAMMAVLRLNRGLQHTLSGVVTEARDARNMANFRLEQWTNAMHEHDEANNQLAQMTHERDVLATQLEAMTLDRNRAMLLAEGRRRGRHQDRIRALEYQNYLQFLIEDGLIEIHRLNNMLDPIPPPALVDPDLGPQVRVAEDDGVNADVPAVPAPEENANEEPGPVGDEEGEVIIQAELDDGPAA